MDQLGDNGGNTYPPTLLYQNKIRKMKISARELRIGNWVKYEGRHFQMYVIAQDVPFLDTLEFGDGVVEWKDLEPIPLTEEWLKRFGFKKSYSELTYKEYDFKKLGVEINSDIITVSYNYGNDVEWLNFTHIKHVHQLQNLYFALTGEELTINEEAVNRINDGCKGTKNR